MQQEEAQADELRRIRAGFRPPPLPRQQQQQQQQREQPAAHQQHAQLLPGVSADQLPAASRSGGRYALQHLSAHSKPQDVLLLQSSLDAAAYNT